MFLVHFIFCVHYLIASISICRRQVFYASVERPPILSAAATQSPFPDIQAFSISDSDNLQRPTTLTWGVCLHFILRQLLSPIWSVQNFGQPEYPCWQSILFLLLGRRPTNWVADETNISSKDKSKERRMKTEGRMSKREKVQKRESKIAKRGETGSVNLQRAGTLPDLHLGWEKSFLWGYLDKHFLILCWQVIKMVVINGTEGSCLQFERQRSHQFSPWVILTKLPLKSLFKEPENQHSSKNRFSPLIDVTEKSDIWHHLQKGGKLLYLSHLRKLNWTT